MTLIISSHETFFHKATRMVVMGEDTAIITRQEDGCEDIKFVSSRFAWVVVKAMAEDGVTWFGEAVR